MLKQWFIIGCLGTASFFVGCNSHNKNVAESSKEATDTSMDEEEELEMYEASELALLMRKMYDDNVEIGHQIEAGNIPESFPEDFYNIHTAIATPGMLHDTTFYNNMAAQYLANMDRITEAKDPAQAKIAYNEMIMTCAGCHQVYCQGPLGKIRKMKLPVSE